MISWDAKIPRGLRTRLPAPPACTNDALLCSPGARYTSEHLKGRWLIFLIVSHQRNLSFSRARAQKWRLERQSAEGTLWNASLTCTDTTTGRVLLSQIILTDFPRPDIEFLVRNNCLFFPSEDWTAPRSTLGLLRAILGQLVETVSKCIHYARRAISRRNFGMASLRSVFRTTNRLRRDHLCCYGRSTLERRFSTSLSQLKDNIDEY